MAQATPNFDTLLVPMQLEAFVLNPAVCGTGADGDTTTRISPITQPNYTFLRLDKFLLQSDLQFHTDLHNTAPSTVNPRMTDLGARPTPLPLRHRHGVYIHWILPRFYRAGVTSGPDVSKQRRRDERSRRGLHDAPGSIDDDGANESPEFVEPATRWIVIRELDLDSVQPPEAKDAFKDRKYEAWVVESDFQWSLEEIPLSMDLQTDLAPFVAGHAGGDVNIDEQAEVFIGKKTPLAKWTGVEDTTKTPPNISLLMSGNQLFADFQMHNSNVFSVLDNFQYGADNAPQYLDGAKANYYVLGWHWKDDADPLWVSGKKNNHAASLDGLFMNILGLAADDSWFQASNQMRLMCHGAMYDVTWDHNNKPKNVPADKHNARLMDQSLAATAIGTTPMDAIITYCAARKAHPDAAGDITRLEETILAIESLLYARDDGVEDQRQARDTIYSWSFERSVGGSHFHFSGNDGDTSGQTQPVEPTKPAIAKMRELNQAQTLLDTLTFSLQQYRWDMFSLWWKYISDVGNSGKEGEDGEGEGGDGIRTDDYPALTKDLSEHIDGLQTRIQDLQARIKELLSPDPETGENLLATAKPASKPVFYRNNDPTVLVGGIEAGWPVDYLDKVSVRMPTQTIPLKSGVNLPAGLDDIVKQFTKLSNVLQEPAADLVKEFFALGPAGQDSGTAPEGKFYPQFHDQKTEDQRWRDKWGDRQPWFPLYMEWEVEYYHVPFEWWSLDEHTARLSTTPLVRYGVAVPPKDGAAPPLWDALPEYQGEKGQDARVLSGRVLILPQPSFSLGAKVTQLFDNTPESILNQYISEDDRKFLRENINKLSYLSSPLSGFTEGILTLAQGSHIKPENVTVTPQGETSEAIKAAIVDSAGLTKDRIEQIQGKSALTPYATMTNFKEAKWSPFKPATHGQFRFKKLNIVDKFGQALQAIDQNPREEGPPPIYPCISDFYEPQTVSVGGKEYANTVIQDTIDQCEFMQLPPKINQNARLNAAFVMRIADDPTDIKLEEPKAKWRPATEWENPIWGWIITNYADYGIQLFLPDGTFYREVRFGGPLGALKSPQWLPFAPDNTDPTPQTKQLDALAEKLSDKDYLQGFWNMILRAQANLSAAPTSYAQFLNSIVGKPLALVNMGWSLELDRIPLSTESTLTTITEPERQLLPPAEGQEPKPYYQFQVRLGNQYAEYDGLVGYFDTTTPTSDQLNLDTVKTFFVPDSGTEKPLEELTTDNYPIFTSFFEPPFPTAPPYDDTNPEPPVAPEIFEDRINSHLSVFGAIIDVFTPVQAYSSFLPPVSLSLPPWTWQKAMNTMTAFFHAGPLTIPLQDVPDYDPSQLLTSQNARDLPKRDLPLPGLGPGDWSWFQPYAVEDALRAAEADDPTTAKFNPFGIEKRGNLLKPGFQEGPYAAIEGYIQLRNPIMMPRPDPPPETFQRRRTAA